MVLEKFEDIIAWQKAQDLAVLIYATFRDIKDYSFKDQVCRAVVSISNNIAEGFDRNSDADFSRFLYIAISSSSETRSMLYLANKLGYINTDKRDELLAKANEVSMIIRGLIKAIK
jgi:four helix bundle protein